MSVGTARPYSQAEASGKAAQGQAVKSQTGICQNSKSEGYEWAQRASAHSPGEEQRCGAGLVQHRALSPNQAWFLFMPYQFT